MKNKFFIAGLVLPILLTGCWNKDDGIPTKSKYSHEVTYAEFNEKIDNVFSADFMDGAFSFVSKSRITLQVKMKLVDEDNTKVGNATSKARYDYVSKYDSDNDLAYTSVSGSRETIINVNGERQSDSDKANFSRSYQSTGGENPQTVSVNQKAEEVYFLGDYEDNKPVSQTVKTLALPILFIAFGTMNFDTKTQEEKDKWKFYIDSGVFTAVYTTDSNESKTHLVGEQDVKYADVTTVEQYIFQVQGKKTENQVNYLACYFEIKENKSTTYVTDYEDDDFTFLAGQTLTQKSATTIGVRLTASNVTLSRVDLTGYHIVDVDEEAQEHDIFN